MISAQLRLARDAIVADSSLRGRAFSEALTAAVDTALAEAFGSLDAAKNMVVVALGSYARRELCPGSDIDVVLVHNMKSRQANVVQKMTEQLWYPLWDAGFVTGHGARTIKDSIALADEDLDALTALLDVRPVIGSVEIASELEAKARDLARKRSDRVLRALHDGAELRRARPGIIAEMLEPDVKEGAGGLRDVQSLEWAGWALGEPGGVQTLVAQGYLSDADRRRIEVGGELLLDVRVALHRATTARSDRLALQEQDAVAAALEYKNADALIHDLSSAARTIAWITADVWSRLRDTFDPRARGATPEREVAEGVRLRDGRVAIEVDADGSVPALRAIEAAVAAAEDDLPFDRASLERLQATTEPTWDVWQRAAFVRLLRTGAHAVPVFEALDHEGVLTRLLPEWEHVRSRPQRNAYHRYTVDRHLLEAVAQCAVLLDVGDQPRNSENQYDVDYMVARACRRPELLLFGALLHDIAKGMRGDHSVVGADVATQITRRMRFDSEGREIVAWLVRNHLLLADIATRRDLSDATVIDNVAEQCAGDAERLRLLYLLTIGDSKATGPSAWSPAKAALVRDLFVKVATAIERGEARALAADRRDALTARVGQVETAALIERLPEPYLLAFEVDDMVRHMAILAAAPTVVCTKLPGNAVEITVVAEDRLGLLATLSGALTIGGVNVLDAQLHGTNDGWALDVFRGTDPYGRVDDGKRIAELVEAALAGEVDLAGRVDERRRSYVSKGSEHEPVQIVLNNKESPTDTLVEVHADDDLGLLYRLASTFLEFAIDVRVAKVATLGSRVVDVFYVRDAAGRKITDPTQLKRLHDTILTNIAR
ncbi:MAG TPA: [protein-PII] uridylyltransferase [Acidimicrobiia bacterium]|nr:[protein-PII] uridylyltransferase [Acidimicrobiia bacterium]